MAEFYAQPLRLIGNQIARSILPGGREVMRLRGDKNPSDDLGGECTIGCTVRFPYAETAPDRRVGQSHVIMPDGRSIYLQDAIDKAPAFMLGKKHFLKYGNNMQLLLKYLDSVNQLALQAHPTTQRAKEAFGEENGKCECWYVVDVRTDAPEPPYVLAGFKQDITPEKFEALFEAEDIAAMEACCHKIPVSPDEMYFIPGGLVHAVGVGCLIIEIQEPSDLIVKVFKNPDYPLGEEAWKRLQMDTYDYEPRSYEENISKVLVARKIVQDTCAGQEQILIGKEQTPFFGGMRYVVKDRIAAYNDDFYSLCVVVAGSGRIVYSGGEIAVQKGDEIFLPAGVKDPVFVSDSDKDELVIIRALPPGIV